MHTTHTIESLRSQTKELGRQLRCYANKLCPKYATKLLPGEAAAAYRRQAKKYQKAAPKVTTPKKTAPASQQPQKPNTKPKTPKGSGFNLQTYKIHALGDYADNIEQFGPTDCFSTQQVCFRAPPILPVLTTCYRLNRENLNTAESRGSTSEPTRCGLSGRLPSMSGSNVTIGSTSTRSGEKPVVRQHLDPVCPQTLLKAHRRSNTTRWRRGTGTTWISIPCRTSIPATLR